MRLSSIRENYHIANAGKVIASAAFAAASSILAKQVYDLSLQVLNKAFPCPYLLIGSYACGSIATLYCSWKISPFAAEPKPSERPVPIHKPNREIVAFDPGEAETLRRSERLKEKLVTDEISQEVS